MKNLLMISVLGVACSNAPETADHIVPDARSVPEIPSERPVRDSSVSFLDRYDFDQRLWYRDLPGRLDEVSGLGFSPDGRLFAHDDELGRVHEIDPHTGEVEKRFDLGEELVRGDFEGITIVGHRFFLITSVGELYEFREGQDREDVAFVRTDLGLQDRCEVEGLDYDSGRDALLVACKTSRGEDDHAVVHRISLRVEAASLPDLRILRSDLETLGVDASFAPSGVAVTPMGTVLVISARNDALVEVDHAGRVVAAVGLPSGRHPQPEGIAIGGDGTLYIADEKNGKEPRLTAYGARSDRSGEAS